MIYADVRIRFAGGVRVDDARPQRKDQQQAPRGALASAALDLQNGRGRGENAIYQRGGDLEVVVSTLYRSTRDRSSRVGMSLRFVTGTRRHHEESVSSVSLAKNRHLSRARNRDSSDSGVYPNERGLKALKGADQRREEFPLFPRSLCGSTYCRNRSTNPHSDIHSCLPIADSSPRLLGYCYVRLMLFFYNSQTEYPRV